MPAETFYLVLVPTYNEAENVEALVGRIMDLGLDASMLFVDDNSPDGTGGILRRIADKTPGCMQSTGKASSASAARMPRGLRGLIGRDFAP